MFDSQNFQGLFRGLQVSLRLILRRLRLLEVGHGNDAVLVQVLRPRVTLLRQGECVFSLEIIGAGLGKVGAGHI